MPKSEFDVQFRPGDGTNGPVVVVGGEIDLVAEDAFRRGLDAAGAGRETVAVDLSRVTFIDSTGLRVLLEANQRQREADLSLIVRAPSEVVCRALELIGVTSILQIED